MKFRLLIDKAETILLWVLPFSAVAEILFGEPRVAVTEVAAWFLLRRARDAEAAGVYLRAAGILPTKKTER